ncbi:MAG: lamin tail domain-containing protein [Akkermansiaceae bacterium]
MSATPVISEFMASNNGGLLDKDGASSDWIEIRNTGTSAIDLAGWKLTDDASLPAKWTFPTRVLQPGELIVVFASGKNLFGAELHTNFSLSKNGEYLALIDPSGTPSTSFSPAYPPQQSGISYGSSVPSNQITLIDENGPCKARVPNFSYHSSIGNSWRDNAPSFNETGWLSGTQGVGYERNNGFQGDINLDVENVMYNNNTSVYIRIPFNLPTLPNNVLSLTLRMKYDDGFAAFINGGVPANGSAHAPASPTWNSTTEGGNSTESQATTFLDFDVSDLIGELESGSNNILAIHGLNASPTSSDLLFRAELIAQVAQPGQSTTGYFASATPGTINGDVTVEGFLTDTEFDLGRGLYSSSFTETITCADLGSTIIYTTDGSVPSLTNGTQVPAADESSAPSASVSITTTTVLRAIAVKSGFEPTNVDTQTYLFINDVLTQNGAGLPTPSTSTSTWDYEMDPQVVNDPRYSNLADDLQTLPILSIVMPNEDVWGNNGVYANPKSFGSAWERACSVEVINPDGSPGYQVDGGLRIQGSGSRNRAIGKKSMRLAFRKSYGSNRFKYPLWGPTGPSEVANLVLRGSYFDSWTFQSDSSSADAITRSNALQFRTHYATVAHARTGNLTISSNWVHLYINGQYWGPYNTHERPDAEFAEYHMGGDESDYSVIKTNVEVVEGSRTKFDELIGLCNPYSASNHQAILDLIDENQFIDYIFANFWGGNADWPHNNWYTIRNDTLNGRFQFFIWDPENYLYITGNNRTTVNNNYSPGIIYDRLRRDPEFQVHFGDRVHQLMFNNGIYSAQSMQALLQDIADELEPAMNCEAARWGDEHTSSPYNTIDDWLPHVAYRKNTYIPARHNIVLTQLKNVNLYPLVNAPSFSQHGGVISANFQLSMSNPNTSGNLYFTTDGSDPRLSGGNLSPTAQVYNSSITLSGSTTVKARSRTENGEWSALNQAIFTTGETPTLANIAITEIHYHPADATAAEQLAGFTDKDDFEFIELMNTGSSAIDLTTLEFIQGISFNFSTLTNTLLDPGERILLARNSAAYAERYGSSNIPAGNYTGRLSNDGETIVITQGGNVLLSFDYNDNYPWPDSADGQGASLVLINPSSNPLHGDPNNWRASSTVHGTPNSGETLPPYPANPLADADGNGRADLVDYAVPHPAIGSLTNGDLTIQFTTNPAAENATTIVQYSDNLTQWTSASDKVEFVSETYNSNGTITYVWRSLTPANGQNKQFLRVQVLER